MKKFVSLLAAGIIACAFAAAPASATILLDVIDAPPGNTPYSLVFNAATNSTTISISGYHPRFFESASNIGLFFNGGGTNLLDTTWGFTPAPFGSYAGQSEGVLYLNGLVVGSYDTFFQTIGTSAGASYTLNFDYSSNSAGLNDNEPSGFRVSATDAVPEPETWEMMLLGFGAIGFTVRRKRSLTPHRPSPEPALQKR